MPDYRITVEGGDLDEARKALSRVGAPKIGASAESRDHEPHETLEVFFDDDSPAAAREVVTAVLPLGCRVAKIERL